MLENVKFFPTAEVRRFIEQQKESVKRSKRKTCYCAMHMETTVMRCTYVSTEPFFD